MVPASLFTQFIARPWEGVWRGTALAHIVHIVDSLSLVLFLTLLWFSRKKAADTGSLLTHAWSDLAGYLIDTLPVEFLPPPACVRSIVSWQAWPLWCVIYFDWLVLSARLLVYYVCCHLVARWGYYSLYIWSCSLVAMWGYYSLLLYVLLFRHNSTCGNRPLFISNLYTLLPWSHCSCDSTVIHQYIGSCRMSIVHWTCPQVTKLYFGCIATPHSITLPIKLVRVTCLFA